DHRLCGTLYTSVSREGPYPWAIGCHIWTDIWETNSLEEFEDDRDVVDILDHFLNTRGLDAGTRDRANAHKLDEATQWLEWAEEVDLAMSALTGPEALHYFHLCCRKHLGTLTAHGDGTTEATTCHRQNTEGINLMAVMWSLS
ncbi:MAG: hypothetical protein ACKPKO_58615, partial [Candidatus Fonsibacter sp.]